MDEQSRGSSDRRYCSSNQDKADKLNLEIQDLRQKLEVFKGKKGDALPDQSANYLVQREAYQSLIAKDRVDLERLRNEYSSRSKSF